MKKPMKKRTVILIAVLSVIAVALTAAVIFYIRINDPRNVFSNELNETAESTPDMTEDIVPEPSDDVDLPETSPSPSPTVDPMIALESQADSQFSKNRVNILILGIDKSAEREDWGSFRTDTMLLLTIDFDNNDVDLISIPRDSYVRIYNTYNDDDTPKYAKINSAFTSGGGSEKSGYKYAMETVSYVLGGVKVQYYVAFDMQVVKDVVNAMGGVDYDVDVQINMDGRTLYPGQQHLDGQAVLDYCRQRKGSSDIARIDRQQRMLVAIFSQLKSTNQIFNIPSIYQAVASNIDTSLSFEQICSLALFATRINTDNIERHTLPGKGLYFNSRSFWVLRMSGVQSLVKEIFGINPSIDWSIDIDSITEQIEEEQNRLAELSEKAQSLIEQAQSLLESDPSLTSVFEDKIKDLQSLVSDGDEQQLTEGITEMEELLANYSQSSGEETAPPSDDSALLETPSPSDGSEGVEEEQTGGSDSGQD